MTSKNKKGGFVPSLEAIVSISEWSATILVLVGALVAVVALKGGKTLRKQEKAEFIALEEKTEAYRVSAARTELELEAQKERAANAEKDAAEAKSRSLSVELKVAEANRGWEEAKRDAAESNRAAAEANKAAKGFELDIAKANERAAEANRIAESERLERIKLEEKILVPRTISSETESHLLTLLRGSAKGKALVSSVGSTSEAVNYANRIAGILRDAGWTVRQNTMIDWSGTGISILVKDVSRPYEVPVMLQRNFISAGIPIDVLQAENVKIIGDNDVQIFIGTKF